MGIMVYVMDYYAYYYIIYYRTDFNKEYNRSHATFRFHKEARQQSGHVWQHHHPHTAVILFPAPTPPLSEVMNVSGYEQKAAVPEIITPKSSHE